MSIVCGTHVSSAWATERGRVPCGGSYRGQSQKGGMLYKDSEAQRKWLVLPRALEALLWPWGCLYRNVRNHFDKEGRWMGRED